MGLFHSTATFTKSNMCRSCLATQQETEDLRIDLSSISFSIVVCHFNSDGDLVGSFSVINLEKDVCKVGFD